MKTPLVVFPDLNTLESLLVCPVLGQDTLRSLKGRTADGVMIKLAIPQSVYAKQ
jgi:hypothetical protein